MAACNEKPISAFDDTAAAHKLETAQSAYHGTWYIPAICELAALPEFRDDPKWIASALRSPISPTQAREALVTLCELGLLVRDASGRLRQVETLVTTGPGPLGHHIVNYLRAMMQHAGACAR